MTKLHRLTLLIMVLLIILYSGLTPKDFNSQQTASILPEGGLEFTKYSLVKTDPIGLDQFTKEQVKKLAHAQKGDSPIRISMSLAVSKFAEFNDDTFKILATLSSNDASQQISIGQWENSILAVRGNDYRNAADAPILIFKLPQPLLPQNKIALHFSQKMAYIELNDSIVNANSNISWTIPSNPFVVTLGNTLQRTNTWSGVLDEFKLSIQTERDPNINHFEVDAKNTPSSIDSKNVLHYRFQTSYLENNQLIKNIEANDIDLHLEPAWTISNFEWLWDAKNNNVFSINLSLDSILNFLGFIPFGFLLMLTIFDRRRVALFASVTCITGIALSLGIETIQAMIPSRTSSMQDLVLNSAGTVFGCVAVITLSYIRDKIAVFRKQPVS